MTPTPPRLDVLALGEPMIEFNQTTPGRPGFLQGFGGDTSNAAIAAARSGARAGVLTRIGDDAFGRMLLDLWRTGRLPLDRLITRRIGLDEVNEAFDDLKSGKGIRSVIVNDTAATDGLT